VNHRILGAAGLLAAFTLSACGMQGQQNSVTQSPQFAGSHQVQAARTIPVSPGPSRRSCADTGPGYVHCDALLRTDIVSTMDEHPDTVSGYGPSDLQTAYALTALSASNGASQTIAVVDAFKDKSPGSDLKIYRAEFGLPPCTTTSGCLTVHAFGSATDEGWAEEESLDLDMASAICPKCKILLVEASSSSITALVTAEKYAKMHATVISNSWGGSESGPSSADAAFASSTQAIVASTGDSGYNVPAQWPAILPTVVGAGGTSLTSISPRKEAGWSGAGSGCSVYYAKPSFQAGVTTGCKLRAQADASADADPNTGVAVYDSGIGGWAVFGGTSVASPILASVFALAGVSANDNPAHLYSNKTHLNDVTTGPSNGGCGAPLCKPGKGWDGPTGLGSPNGDAAF
jgi:subtilase family serine protease